MEKNGNIIIGAVDVVSTCSWVEGFEFEISPQRVVARVSTDKVKLATATVKLYALCTSEDEQVIVLEHEMSRIGLINDACRFEATMSKAEFLTIKTSNILRIEVFNLLRDNITVVEFDTQKMISALKTEITRESTMRALAEQAVLQKNLLFNLNHKAKEYMKNPNISQDLGEQFEAMKLRLINEVNDPQLLSTGCPKHKTYVTNSF